MPSWSVRSSPRRLDPPFRAELLDASRLQDLARTLGGELEPVGSRRRSRPHARLADNAAELQRAHLRLTADARARLVIGPAAEWLIDNRHLIDAEIEALRRDLPARFYRRLPVVADDGGQTPRVERLARTLIAHSDSRLDREQMRVFLDAFQTVSPLTLGELWAWPSVVRLVLVENLRRLAALVLAARDSRRAADAYVDALHQSGAFTAPAWPVEAREAYISRVVQRTRDEGELGEAVREALEARLVDAGATVDDGVRDDQQREGSLQVLVANTVTSLRLCSTMEWAAFVEAVSPVDHTLRRDPAGVYARMDFQSRDRQRKAIEALSPFDGRAQLAAAARAVDAALAAPGGRAGHVGFHLIGPGRLAFRTAVLGRPATIVERLAERVSAQAGAIYFTAIAGLTAAGLALLVWSAGRGGASTLAIAVLAAAFAFPFAELATALAQRIVAALVPPDRLPRLELTGGVPAEARTMVIVPALLTSLDGVRRLVDQLGVAALANADPHVHFALLSDFADAVEPEMPDDAALLAAAVDGIEALNRGAGVTDRFFLFHRARQWNPTEGVWMGWERKRGKIEEFNRRLRGAADTTYAVEVGDLAVLPGIRYCLTLDADTRLPRDVVRTLVGILEHPLNRPRVDAATNRVVEGYGILQPRVSITLASAGRSRFARLSVGHTGVDPYTTAVSDVYQDLFAEGIFTGKGLYDVDTFVRVLDGRLPDNAILSHDLIEGLFARVALVTDVEVVDDYPASVLAHAQRQHRWVRGDWQILKWLFPVVPTRDAWTANPLPWRSRWKIVDNLRRSLTGPATLAALLMAWTLAPGSPWPWTIAALAAPLAPAVVRALAAVGPLLVGRIDRRGLGQLREDLSIDLARAALDVLFLAQTASAMVHAIALTLVRMLVTRRRLLEWETAAASAARTAGWSVRGYAEAMIAGSMVAAATLVLLVAVEPLALRVALPFVVAWAAAPWVAHALSQPVVRRFEPLHDEDRAYLLAVAADTWRFFATFVTPEHHALPPDNVQFVPELRVAARTSPTNIGMALLSTLAAIDLGFIAPADGVSRLEATLDTLERLDKVRGHLLNWYDTRTLAPLEPRYVSTVDSGNLAGALLTLGVGLEALVGAADDSTLAARLGRAADRARQLSDAMDFSFLFDPKRELFAVGARVDDPSGAARLDTSHYDLLASEARLASFLAIARGQVPQRHWFRLGRRVAPAPGGVVLLSWSGTMFEYLMPPLLMRADPETLLGRSAQAAVAQQRAYATSHGVPWGLSECAYAATDHEQTYRYRAFGVPGLGMARGLDADLVVAPYATALALAVAPGAAVENLRRLAALGLRVDYGFLEAIDFTTRDATARNGAPRTGTLVQTCMSHHQGMTLVAIANALRDDIMVRRFHRVPAVRATELLLHERMPRDPTTQPFETEDELLPPVPAAAPAAVRRYRTPHTPVPHAQLLSNGRYVVAITNGGGGASAWRDLAVTRWRRDATTDPASQVLYLRDVRTGRTWSGWHQPTNIDADEYVVTFHPDRASVERRDGDLWTLHELTVSPEDDLEVRRLTLRNHGPRLREIEVTSYAELALASMTDDLAHPAFAKLFVETEFSPENAALVCRRRPRHGGDERWAVHVLGLEGRAAGPVEWESDRERFIGRGRSLANPQALDGRALSGTTGVVFDPICSLRVRVRVPPRGQVRLSFSTGIAATREGAQRLAQTYHHPNAASRAFALAYTHAQGLMQHLSLTPEDVRLFERLASPLHYVDESARGPASAFELNSLGQPGLWRHGISGDLPIVVVRVTGAPGGPDLVRRVLQAQEYWRLKGLASDTVVVNEQPASYLDEAQGWLAALLTSGPWRSWQSRRGGVWLLRREALDDAEDRLLDAVGRVVVYDRDGGLRAQLDPRQLDDRIAGDLTASYQPLRGQPAPPSLAETPAVGLALGVGRFDAGGRELVLAASAPEPPVPWANLLANEHFGTVVTHGGSSYTWGINSRENRLTPFANDPVIDPTPETIYLRDDDRGLTWTPTRRPAGTPAGRDGEVRHRPGLTSFTTECHGIRSELEVLVDARAPVKISRLTLVNGSEAPRRLRVVPYCQWALGPPRDGHALHVVTRYDSGRGAVLATNPFNDALPTRVAFLAASHPPRAATGNRTRFLGRHGTMSDPAGVREGLSGEFGGGWDPCAALDIGVELGPGEAARLVVVLGQGADADEALSLIDRFASLDGAESARRAVDAFWADTLDAVQVRTPDDSFDVMMNTWLLYQTLACRVFARTGYYQPGGAYGFRDQLQDVMALLHARPELARAHLLRAAGRQFVEGDVQHWWHEPTGRGLRSRCSDDRLWLPYVVAEYVRVTGDRTLLHDRVPYLRAPLLDTDEVESYGQPEVGPEDGTVLDHCRRAVEASGRRGRHGLPLMGHGDWNDGMNLVGAEGRGESVWLGFFLHVVYGRLAWLCETEGDGRRGAAYRREAARLEPALENAWDGEWFRRGYYDDGTPLGSAHNDDCRIDSIAQSWAVLSTAVPRRQAERAMDAVRVHLVSRHSRTLALLSPPFDRTAQEPGYIKGYPPGVRENGGHYTHAAAWVVMALARLGAGDEAMELFHMANPVNRARTRQSAERYRLEPYVVAGDISTHPAHAGRGGWSWYTGSAGWLYRAGLEQLLGVKRRSSTFAVDPCIPMSWSDFEVTWRVGRAVYRIRVDNPQRVSRGVASAWLDGVEVDASAIPLTPDGTHDVEVVLGDRPAAANGGSVRTAQATGA